MENFSRHLTFLEQLHGEAKHGFCRVPVLVCGNKKQRQNLVEQFQNSSPSPNFIYIDSDQEKSVKLTANTVIGQEYQTIAYDIENKFDPNLFSAISGTLVGGGLFLILCPQPKSWLKEIELRHDWFLWRFVNTLISSKQVVRLDMDKPCPSTNSVNKENINPLSALSLQGQNQAIEDIIHVVKGHRNRPLVILADRGRGKSAALGIASATLVNQGLQKILITAPSLEACSITYKHFNLALNESNHSKINKLQYIPPDILVKELPKADLLIIDEASGIHTPFLETFLQKYSRIVFSSTIHGYEGSGHCFALKFFKALDKTTPNWKKIILTQPIRWSDSDPLEKLINSLFLFKPIQTSLNETEIDNRDQISIRQISQKKLVQNETILSQLYELLSSAHYKTRPSDLKNILSNDAINIYLMLSNNQLIAAAFTILEGEINSSLSEKIYSGISRPKGNIVPQILAMHLGFKKATEYKYCRIMRIAVLPNLQNMGYGSQLVESICENAKEKSLDAVACTFAATDSLLKFWGKHQFFLLRLGFHKKSDSNGFAALMLKPISKRSQGLCTEAKTHFINNFPFQLQEIHQNLDTNLTLASYQNINNSNAPNLCDKEWEDLESFAFGSRQFEDNLAILHKFTHYVLQQPRTFDLLEKPEQSILVLKILQKKSWKETTDILKISGRKQGIKILKETISKLLRTYHYLSK